MKRDVQSSQDNEKRTQLHAGMASLDLIENVGTYTGQLGQLTSTQSSSLAMPFHLQGELFNEIMMAQI